MLGMRGNDNLKSFPVIMLLAVGATKKGGLDAVALRLSGFVVKPFRPDQR